MESDEQLLALTRYIHTQGLALENNLLNETQPNSYAEYTGKRQTDWVHPEGILEYFEESNSKLSYQQFVKEWKAQEIENRKLEQRENGRIDQIEQNLTLE